MMKMCSNCKNEELPDRAMPCHECFQASHWESNKKRGRKKTGRKRNKVLNGAKFTELERSKIINNIKKTGMTQTSFLIRATDFFMKYYMEENNDHNFRS